MRKWAVGPRVAAVGAVLAVLATAACSAGATGASSTTDGGSVRTVIPLDQRTAPVQLSGTTLEGKHLDVSSLRGKPVVINVWGAWCGPCRAETPDVQAAATELGDRAAFVGIDTREDSIPSGQAYQRRFKLTYPSLYDQGELLLALRGAVSAQSPPVTVVLDKQGRIAGRFIGPVTKQSLIDMVTDVSTTP